MRRRSAAWAQGIPEQALVVKPAFAQGLSWLRKNPRRCWKSRLGMEKFRQRLKPEIDREAFIGTTEVVP
jgi:hypothetical protein